MTDADYKDRSCRKLCNPVRSECLTVGLQLSLLSRENISSPCGFFLAVAEWLTGDDTGISSKYMAAVAIGGKVTKSSWGDPTPSDAPDLGRCVRLVEKCPAIRETFPVLRQASRVWAAYLDHWDELVALYKLDNYTKTTARMRELRASANDKVDFQERSEAE